MKPLALFLGFVASVVVGIMQYNRLETGIITGTVEHKYTEHPAPCRVLGIAIDGKSPPVPEGMIVCPAGTPIPADERWKPLHLSEKLFDTAATSDTLTIQYTQFTPVFGNKGRMVSVSCELRRDVNANNFPDLAPPPIYSTIIVQTAIPFAVGLLICGIHSLIFRAKKT